MGIRRTDLALEARELWQESAGATTKLPGVVAQDGLRDGLMRKIANAASADCASLPWGVFAMHGMRDPQAQAEASALLTQRWKECHEGRE